MTYATQQDLIDRFGQQELIQLTDRTHSGSIDAAVSGKALADADDAINDRISTSYTLPLANVPRSFKRLAADIARYFLYEDRATEQVTKRHDDAIKFFDAVRDGKIKLGPDASDVEPAQTGGPSVDAGDRTFSVGRPSTGTEGTLDDYV